MQSAKQPNTEFVRGSWKHCNALVNEVLLLRDELEASGEPQLKADG